MENDTQTQPNQQGQAQEEQKPAQEDQTPTMIMGPVHFLFREITMPDTSKVKELLVALPHEPERLYRIVGDMERLALPDDESKMIIEEIESLMQRQMARAQLLQGGPGGPPPGAPIAMIKPQGGPHRR